MLLPAPACTCRCRPHARSLTSPRSWVSSQYPTPRLHLPAWPQVLAAHQIHHKFKILDLTMLAMDANALWFDDLVHYGKNWQAGMQLMALNVIMNVLCQP